TPGQFYYNIFYVGDGTTDPNNPVVVTINIPYPFVTQGANPLHVYSGVTVGKNGTQTCFVPGTEVLNLKQTIPLTAYDPNPTVGASTPVTVQLPDLRGTGFAY